MEKNEGLELEEKYKREAFEIVKQMNLTTQKKAVNAIKHIQEEKNKSWHWIATALRKKSISNYEKYFFGLWWNENFNGSVYQQMERELEEEQEEDAFSFFFDVDDITSGDFYE